MQTATDMIWDEFRRTHSIETKRRLAMQYTGVVRFVVRKFRSHSKQSASVIDEQDLMQLGMIGLLDSIERFDPARGVKFETYAITRIRGTVQDELRKLDWVPRSVREKVRTLDRMTQKIECDGLLAASPKKIAAGLQMSVDEYIKMLHEARGAAFDGALHAEGSEDAIDAVAADSEYDPAERIQDEQTKNMLVGIIEQLPPQDRLIISLYYYEELTFKEIATVLRLSESRVFQKHAAILERLREHVGELV